MALGTSILQDPIESKIVYGNVLVFSFTIPTDTENKPLSFKLELDVVDPPVNSSGDYRDYRKRP